MTEKDVKALLSNTESLMNHVYWVQQAFPVQPNKDHRGVAINFNDINERRHDFLVELQKTVTSWVYSKAAQSNIFQERLADSGHDLGNAAEHLSLLARRKFRKGHSQGQFGELLLFNFLQFFFNSPPLLRKMPIATSSSHERFGADAIHYCKRGIENLLILGESKCYKSSYKFKVAFKESLASIINSFRNLDSELDLYTYDDFIDQPLQEIAKNYKSGKLADVKFELVCLVAYNENEHLSLKNEMQIKKDIIKTLERQCNKIEPAFFDEFASGVLQRVNYILFPIWHLDSILADFNSGR